MPFLSKLPWAMDMTFYNLFDDMDSRCPIPPFAKSTRNTNNKLMNDHGQWLIDLGGAANGSVVDGLVLVSGYQRDGRPPEEVVMMEKAKSYVAHSVFFEAGRNGRPPVAQA